MRFTSIALVAAAALGVVAISTVVDANRYKGPKAVHVHHVNHKNPAYGAYGYDPRYRYVPADAYGSYVGEVNYNGAVDLGGCARAYVPAHTNGTDSLCNRQNGSVN